MSDATDNNEYSLDEVQKLADQVRAAVAKKLPEYTFFTRVHETAHFDFVELVARPHNSQSPLDEKQVAHSAAYYADMATPEIKLKRARRILRDMMITLGMPVEDAPSEAG